MPPGPSLAAVATPSASRRGTAEVLIENGISVRANKVMVARSAGAGSVVGYNYMDMGYINTNGAWIEIGLNASHMVGSHHVLFEGNYATTPTATTPTATASTTRSSAITCVASGPRSTTRRAGRIDDATQSRNGPKRCAGLMAYSYWMSFVGNVLGAPGQMDGWVYETTFTGGKPGIWMLGWDGVKPYPTDAQVSATTLRHGNFDYVTNTVKWDPAITNHTLPNSLYLTQKPAFFDAGQRLHLAMGGPGGSDQALHAAGQGALRRRDAVHAALNRRGLSPRPRRRRHRAPRAGRLSARDASLSDDTSNATEAIAWGVRTLGHGQAARVPATSDHLRTSSRGSAASMVPAKTLRPSSFNRHSFTVRMRMVSLLGVGVGRTATYFVFR